jgi:hypothetical protein
MEISKTKVKNKGYFSKNFVSFVFFYSYVLDMSAQKYKDLIRVMTVMVNVPGPQKLVEERWD